ncbi:MAG: hypothetical protein ACKVP0_01790 [Pirellulaceae bacterium]
MSRSLVRIALPAALLAVFCFVGCGGPNKPEKGSGKPDEHGHDHGHDHAHDHPAEGPHHGHLIELAEPGQAVKEEYHVEWDHEETGKVTVWILDGTAKKTVPIAADNVVIEVTAGGKTDAFELPALDRTSGEKASAFKFETTSKELLGKLETVGDNVSAKVRVDVNGKPYEGKFEKHEEHDHAGHKH